MSEYIIEAIRQGVLETLEMTIAASALAYAVGLPLGILLYATASGGVLANRPVNFILGLVVNICRGVSARRLRRLR